MYVTGTFQTYIGSYFGLEKDSALTKDLLPTCVFLYIFTSPVGGFLAQRGLNPKTLIAIGSSVTISLFFISSCVSDAKAFFACYVIAFAFNHGVSYMAPI
mmetsp:Transcript_27699/g.36998  ORF Transcript_27699/g.36998 Transcript_27699/m.36998 type:complete len:100 (+) Transcript_27699:173-472(+)